MNILEEIYNEQYTPRRAAEKLPFSLRLEQRAFFDAVEEAMGAAFLERHWESLCRIAHYRDYANFREGFRLGVMLTRELP